MDVEKRKLTDYEKAELWSQISLSGYTLHRLNSTSQNSAEFYKEMDTLRELEKKLKWHEVALTIEKKLKWHEVALTIEKGETK